MLHLRQSRGYSRVIQREHDTFIVCGYVANTIISKCLRIAVWMRHFVSNIFAGPEATVCLRSHEEEQFLFRMVLSVFSKWAKILRNPMNIQRIEVDRKRTFDASKDIKMDRIFSLRNIHDADDIFHPSFNRCSILPFDQGKFIIQQLYSS